MKGSGGGDSAERGAGLPSSANGSAGAGAAGRDANGSAGSAAGMGAVARTPGLRAGSGGGAARGIGAGGGGAAPPSGTTTKTAAHLLQRMRAPLGPTLSGDTRKRVWQEEQVTIIDAPLAARSVHRYVLDTKRGPHGQ